MQMKDGTWHNNKSVIQRRALEVTSLQAAGGHRVPPNHRQPRPSSPPPPQRVYSSTNKLSQSAAASIKRLFNGSHTHTHSSLWPRLKHHVSTLWFTVPHYVDSLAIWPTAFHFLFFFTFHKGRMFFLLLLAPKLNDFLVPDLLNLSFLYVVI